MLKTIYHDKRLLETCIIDTFSVATFSGEPFSLRWKQVQVIVGII